MAPKRPSPLDEPPAASSSDEHEELSSEEEEEEDEDPSEDAEEEESPKTPPNPSALSSPTKNPSAGNSSKRAKKSGGGGGDEKKQPQRLWSEDDEIAILKGMIEFSSEKGSDHPSADMAAFHEFVKDSIRVEDFTRSQLGDKVRRLRKKFARNAAKSGYEPATPHERKAFELSERIWPNGTPSSSSAALANGSAAVASPDPGILGGVLRLQGTALPESVVRRGLDLLPADKKAELEAEWRSIHLAELDLCAQRTQLVSDQWRMIFDALNSDS